MNDWGSQTWGEPCRECGFSWDTPAEQALATMTTVPARFRAVTDDATGTETGAGLTWSVGAYVCHVADNLRIFAERLVGVSRSGNPRVAAYDQDELAAARHYEDIPLVGAQWSLERAVDDWLSAVAMARAAGATFDHPERGHYQWSDVVTSNLHDALHHEHDIRLILAASSANGS
jgi:hypothetical protein